MNARRLACALIVASLGFGWISACSSPPPYDGGGRVIENTAVSGAGTSESKDSSPPKDTSVPDTSNIPDTSFNPG